MIWFIILLTIVLFLGVLGGWLRRAALSLYGRDLVGWLALASALLLAIALAAFYLRPPTYFIINAAIGLTLLSSLTVFLALGGVIFVRDRDPALLGLAYVVFASPLIATMIFLLYGLTSTGAHLSR